MARPAAVGAGGAAAWLTEQIQAVHLASRGTYGSRRVHAELTLGLSITIGHLVAQWKAQQAAKRPKTAKLAGNDRLRE
jgi:hypothetical protein